MLKTIRGLIVRLGLACLMMGSFSCSDSIYNSKIGQDTVFKSYHQFYTRRECAIQLCFIGHYLLLMPHCVEWDVNDECLTYSVVEDSYRSGVNNISMACLLEAQTRSDSQWTRVTEAQCMRGGGGER